MQDITLLVYVRQNREVLTKMIADSKDEGFFVKFRSFMSEKGIEMTQEELEDTYKLLDMALKIT